MVTVLDDFEDGDIAEYSGNTSDGWEANKTEVYEGSWALRVAAGESAITRTDVTIAPGETPFGAWLWPDVASGSTYSTAGFAFAVQSATGISNLDAYSVVVDMSYEDLKIFRHDDGAVDPTLIGYEQLTTQYSNQWLRAEVSTWDSSGNITAKIYDSNGTLLQTVNASDSTWGSGGIGWVVVSDTGYYSYADYAYKPTPVSAPSTPQNLTSTVSGDDITLDWDAVDWNNDQGHYDVYRAQATGSSRSDYTDIADVSSGTTSYIDSALEDGERYYYRVDANNSEGSSNLSNETASTTALPAPSNLSGSLQ